jgi:PAS domain S-box-containing protein
MERMPTAVYTCDAEGKITFYNKAAEKLWGRSPELGKDMWCGSWKIFTPEGKALELSAAPIATTLITGKAQAGQEIIIQRPDGSRSNVLPHPQPIFDSKGTLIGAFNMLTDITAQKTVLNELRESEMRFRTLADTAPVMIWMADTNKDFIFFNKRWCSFTGKPANEQISGSWISFVHPEDKNRLNNVYNEAFQQRNEFEIEYRLQRYDGSYRWISSQGIPRYSGDGAFLGYIGTCHDINERKLAGNELERRIAESTAELKSKNEELQRSNTELASFSYVASHDLQEPLRKIITFTDRMLLQYGKEMPEGSKLYLDKIVSSSRRMTRLIEDVLNFSRVSRAEEKYSLVDLNDIVKNVLTDFDQLIIEKQAKMNIGPLPVLTAVPLQMTQLFHNLISNALKFSRTDLIPEITITSTPADKTQSVLLGLDPKLQYCNISIVDNGIGFNAEYAEIIFKIFQRLHGKSEYSGTGIGLALCKKIAENHKGSINASSANNQTRFVVTIPLNLEI